MSFVSFSDTELARHTFQPLNLDLFYFLIQFGPIGYTLYFLYDYFQIPVVVAYCMAGFSGFLFVIVFVYVGWGSFVKLDREDGENRLNQKKKRKLSVFERVKTSKVNPFVSLAVPMGLVERIRVAFMAATLVPFRVIGIVSSLLFLYVIARISLLFHCSDDSQNMSPLPWWRRYFFLFFARIFSRIILFCYGFLYISTSGTRARRSDAPIIISNHVSVFEAMYYVYAFGCAPVGARENLTAPLLGVMMRALQIIPVDRSDPNSRAAVQQCIIDRSSNDAWPQILVFPEATTSNGEALILFKVGAFAPFKPIQPCVVSFPSGSCHSCGSPRFPPGWVPAGPQLVEIVLRVLCEPVTWMTVDFLPVYKPTREDSKNAKLFANNVRKYMSNISGIPFTGHSFEDFQLQNEAVRNNFPPELAVLEMESVIEQLHITSEDCKALLLKFVKLDKDKSGKVSYAQFAFAVGSPEDSKYFLRLCELLDEDETGFIDFRHYVLGFGILASKQTNDVESVIRLAFRIFDLNDSGKISSKILIDIFDRYITNDIERISFANQLESFKDLNFTEFKNIALNDARFIDIFRNKFLIY